MALLLCLDIVVKTPIRWVVCPRVFLCRCSVLIVVTYLLAFIHKLNTDYLSPKCSCGAWLTDMYVQMRSIPGKSVKRALVWLAIYGTVILEVLIPVLLLSPRTRPSRTVPGRTAAIRTGLAGTCTLLDADVCGSHGVCPGPRMAGFIDGDPCPWSADRAGRHPAWSIYWDALRDMEWAWLSFPADNVDSANDIRRRCSRWAGGRRNIASSWGASTDVWKPQNHSGILAVFGTLFCFQRSVPVSGPENKFQYGDVQQRPAGSLAPSHYSRHHG